MAFGGEKDDIDKWSEEFSIHESTIAALRQDEYELSDILKLTESDLKELNSGKGLKGGPKRRLLEAIKTSNERQQTGLYVQFIAEIKADN